MFGRAKIYTDEIQITDGNVVEVLKAAYNIHTKNSNEINNLYEYYKGNQPILQRVKTIRPEINNKIVENRANEIISFKTGYLCGEPLQYVSRGGANVFNAIGELNDMMLLAGKSARDKEVAEWMYITGQGYRMVQPNKVNIRKSVIPFIKNKNSSLQIDEAPFNIYTLDPRYTFCVYSSTLGEPCVMGVKYIVREDKRIIYSVYTTDNYYEIESDKITKREPNALNSIPIIEYPLNNARLGSFEIVQDILNAINTVQSNRLDGIEQFIQSLLVLVNADIEDKDVSSIREAGLIKLRYFGDSKAEIKVIAEQLDQSQTQTLIDYMYQTVLNIVGMPNRNGGSSTSDTGAATIVRDGWAAAEARAKDDELMFKESERKFLKIVLSILRDTTGTTLRLADIDTQFTRRNYENILSKAQVLTTMLANDKIAPELAFSSCNMFPDPAGAAKMSAEHYAKVKAEMEKKPPETKPKAGDAVD